MNLESIDNLFQKIMRERESAVDKYLESLESKGVDGNMDAIQHFSVISDADRHLKNLILLGADGAKCPAPMSR